MAHSDKYRDVLDCPAKRLGKALKLHRETRGLAHEEISRRVDYAFTPVVLHMIEAGLYPLDTGQVFKIIRGYDADPDRLLPVRNDLKIDDARHHMAMGPTIRELNQSATTDGLLYEYLAFLYQIRKAQPGSRVPLREDDLAALANTTDLRIEEVRSRLLDLMARWNDPPREAEESLSAQWSVNSRRSSLLERMTEAELN